MLSSSSLSYQNIEAKRQENIEDNRRFLATLKINDIRNQIKEITGNNDDHSHGRKKVQAERIRRSSRIRKQNENLPSIEEKPKEKMKKTTNENKVKLQLPEHMLIRYQSTGKKIALYNPKVKFGDDENENPSS